MIPNSLKIAANIYLILGHLFVLSAQTNVGIKNSNELTLLLKNPVQQAENNVLEWIKTDHDFIQIDKNEKEIDSIIKIIVRKQIHLSNKEIQIPINSKKLKFWNYQASFRNLKIIKPDNLFDQYPNDYKNLDSGKIIFQYENIFILTELNSYEDQWQVYAIIRAFLLIKYRYPDIYRVLFQETESLPLKKVAETDILMKADKTVYLNMNKYYIFSIHSDSKSLLPSTLTSYDYPNYKLNYLKVNNGNYWISENRHCIFLNKQTLRNGGTAKGNKPIYTSMNSMKNYYLYMTDGLIHTIVHERIHNYIGNYQTLDNFLFYIRNNNEMMNNKSFEAANYEFLEEPIVTQTTNAIFGKYGGVSEEVMTYYQELAELQMNRVKQQTDFRKLSEKIKLINRKAKNTSKAEDSWIIYF
jgi:hypothetical protein